MDKTSYFVSPQSASSAAFITPDEVSRMQSATLIEKLSSHYWATQVRSEILGMFARVEPEILTWVRKGHLQLVCSEAQRQVGQILGMQLYTLSHTTQKPKLHGIHKKNSLSQKLHVPDTKHMSQNEFELLVSSYFSDSEARRMIVEILFRARGKQQEHLAIDLTQLWKTEPEDTPTNTHTLGTTETQDPLKVRLTRWWTGEKKRRFEYHYSFAKVRKRQKWVFSDFFPARLSKTLLSHVWLRETQVIDFPKKFSPPKDIPQTLQKHDAEIKLPADTQELCENAFASFVFQIAQLVENIEWLTGARPNIYIPEILRPQLTRLKELEILGGFPNIHAHLESAVLSMMTYLYPEITAEHASKKAPMLSKPSLEKYPLAQDIAPVWYKNAPYPQKKRDGIYLEMDAKIAEHYGFGEQRGIRCSPALIEHIWKIPEDEQVIFEIAGKPVQISAKMFRRIFHRGMPPERGVETGEIIVGNFSHISD